MIITSKFELLMILIQVNTLQQVLFGFDFFYTRQWVRFLELAT